MLKRFSTLQDLNKKYLITQQNHVYVFQADLDQQLDAALELMRRLPPQKSERNLSDIIDLVPELCEDLLASVDQPLKVLKCTETGKNFLLCDYNRDGDSYRLASISNFLLIFLYNNPQ